MNEFNEPFRTAKRQSAPKPSISAAAAAVTASGMPAENMDGMLIGDVSRIEQPIGTAQIQKAQQVLEDYKRGKANLEKRVIADEQWYKLQHWKEFDGGEREDKLMPRTAWLFNWITFPARMFSPASRETSLRQRSYHR